MADDLIFDAVKTLGSLGGLFSAVFLAWERLTKQHPFAVIVARPLIEGGASIGHFLLVKNGSDRPILISWENGNADSISIAKDDSGEAVMWSLYGDERTLVALGPQETATFPLLRPRNYDAIDPERTIELSLQWQFAQPFIWRRERTKLISLRKRDFEALAAGYMASSSTAGA